ncbi:hypothetical protein [Vibrio sp. 10N.247.310.17]|uniref:hypothetical protein n=1 Tax=Vibrio sp. 10N.247.310.17 TaxID=3229979 RepID=UPI00354F64E9
MYTVTTKIDNAQFTITQTNVDKDPNMTGHFGELSVNTSTISLGKDSITLNGEVLKLKVISLAADGSKIALLINQKLSGTEYHLVDILTK